MPSQPNKSSAALPGYRCPTALIPICQRGGQPQNLARRVSVGSCSQARRPLCAQLALPTPAGITVWWWANPTANNGGLNDGLNSASLVVVRAFNDCSSILLRLCRVRYYDLITARQLSSRQQSKKRQGIYIYIYMHDFEPRPSSSSPFESAGSVRAMLR